MLVIRLFPSPPITGVVANGTKTTTAADDMIRSAPQERNKEQ